MTPRTLSAVEERLPGARPAGASPVNHGHATAVELSRLADTLFSERISDQDWVRAADLYRQAAEMGFLEAQYSYGVRLAHGQGVPQNFEESVKWLAKAARQGHPGAQDSLGVRYATGQGVAQNDEAAALWFRKAAEQGHSVAQFNLGLAYVHGQGVEQSYLHAYAWFSLSAEQGDTIAAESRDRVKEAFTPGEVSKAERVFVNLRRAVALLRGQA